MHEERTPLCILLFVKVCFCICGLPESAVAQMRVVGFILVDQILHKVKGEDGFGSHRKISSEPISSEIVRDVNQGFFNQRQGKKFK